MEPIVVGVAVFGAGFAIGGSELTANTATQLTYDGANPVVEKQGATVTGTKLTGLGMDSYLTRKDGTTETFPLTDHLGSVIALTDATGAIVTNYTYEPYCATTQTGTTSTNPHQYTGRENDGTGLYFYRARYYDPQLMRFISEDPIGLAGGMNSYAYVKGNPHRYTDPFGLWTIQLGLSGTYTTPFGRAGAGFAGITFDSQGNVGTYWGGGLGLGIGAGGSGGLSVQGSNAKTICDLRGPFGNVSAGGGWGPGAIGEGFWGPSDTGTVIGGGVTVGAGLGATSFDGINNTWVQPMGRLR